MINTNNLVAAQLMFLLRLFLLLIMLCFSFATLAEESANGFDHFSTGFPLIGRHELIDCSDCHTAGQFKGAPMECGLCHDGARAPGKHVPGVRENPLNVNDLL